MARYVIYMFLYYVKKFDIFHKHVLAKGCTYFDITENQTVVQLVNNKALEDRIPMAEVRERYES